MEHLAVEIRTGNLITTLSKTEIGVLKMGVAAIDEMLNHDDPDNAELSKAVKSLIKKLGVKEK